MVTRFLKRIRLVFKTVTMVSKKKINKSSEVIYPGKRPDTEPDQVPENHIPPEEEPDIIPDEDPFENLPPYEAPEAGEGP